MIRFLVVSAVFASASAFLFVPSDSAERLSENECASLLGGDCLALQVIGHCDQTIYEPTKNKDESCPGQAVYSLVGGSTGNTSAIQTAVCHTPCGNACGTYTANYKDCDGGDWIPFPTVVVVAPPVGP